jgi:hypothetical protein
VVLIPICHYRTDVLCCQAFLPSATFASRLQPTPEDFGSKTPVSLGITRYIVTKNYTPPPESLVLPANSGIHDSLYEAKNSLFDLDKIEL